MTIYEDDAPHVLGAAATLMALGVISYVLRVYVRHNSKMWGLEDTVMTIGIVPFLVLSIACILGGLNGIGVKDAHIAARTDADYATMGMMYFFLFEVFYCAAIIPVKLSISLMLIRIAQNRKYYIWTAWAMMALFFLADGGALFYIIFQCTPVSYAWDTNQDGYCLPASWLADVYYMCTAVNIVTDWTTALLPIPLLWHVKLERSEKMSVAGILGLGIFASLAACVRLNYTINLTSSTNYLYEVSNVLIWGYMEVAVGVFVGCIATLRPLFRSIFRLGSLGSSATKSASGPSKLGFASNARHTYDQFSSHRDYEMGDIGTTSRAYKGSTGPSGPPSTSGGASESDSMEQALMDKNEKPGAGHQGVMVSRQIHIVRTSKEDV
ncbi:hypothetical protein BD289DRAFT_374729 [Coniella lustricola]|uniref:Rhodopsin domain-containing protein n=1 Tax=Coniella lustricola TaxID=2025994 RepID=A0A2T2ZZA1_9PEZI|nr:hypothetical protein BD289DRAFT_374729 [Coniella lustricola]